MFSIAMRPTAVSTTTAPRAASPVNPLGTITGDLKALKDLGSVEEMVLDKT